MVYVGRRGGSAWADSVASVEKGLLIWDEVAEMV